MVTPEAVRHFLSSAVTGKPILYVGMGEKLSDLEAVLSGSYGIPNSWHG
ncbi:MAG: hypothetical protein ACLTTO_08220 [Lachnospiraceae bacterium]